MNLLNPLVNVLVAFLMLETVFPLAEFESTVTLVFTSLRQSDRDRRRFCALLYVDATAGLGGVIVRYVLSFCKLGIGDSSGGADFPARDPVNQEKNN